MNDMQKNPKKNFTEEEMDDLADRLNSVELELVEAKEFSHLSSEVFEILQSQIDELRTLFTELVSKNSGETESSEPFDLEYI